jgi:hypothetical protein
MADQSSEISQLRSELDAKERSKHGLIALVCLVGVLVFGITGFPVLWFLFKIIAANHGG